MNTIPQVTEHIPVAVCVSLGAEGALLSGPDNSHYATAPEVPVDSTVGWRQACLAE